jgi:hypothetical protein
MKNSGSPVVVSDISLLIQNIGNPVAGHDVLHHLGPPHQERT